MTLVVAGCSKQGPSAVQTPPMLEDVRECRARARMLVRLVWGGGRQGSEVYSPA